MINELVTKDKATRRAEKTQTWENGGSEMRKLFCLIVIIVSFVQVGVCVASSFDENIKWLQDNINNMPPYKYDREYKGKIDEYKGNIDTFKTYDFKLECKNTECKYEREVSWMTNNKEFSHLKSVDIFDLRNIGKASIEEDVSDDNYKVYVESMCGQELVLMGNGQTSKHTYIFARNKENAEEISKRINNAVLALAANSDCSDSANKLRVKLMTEGNLSNKVDITGHKRKEMLVAFGGLLLFFVPISITLICQKFFPKRLWLALLFSIIFVPFGQLYLKGGSKYILIMLSVGAVLTLLSVFVFGVSIPVIMFLSCVASVAIMYYRFKKLNSEGA